MVTLSDKIFPFGFSGHSLEGNELEIVEDGETLVRSPAICAKHPPGPNQARLSKPGFHAATA